MLPILLHFTARHPGTSLQQDNARFHSARISLQCLYAVNIPPWPEKTSDVVWNIEQVQIRTPRNIANLEQQLLYAWQNVSQVDISYSTAFGDGPHNFAPWLRDEEDT
ncbi:transposable element Tc1 transposase [Trichonephila clavipes]|nr:transposable element Tc1 transposase [Trichonephila clavipes]